MPETKSRRGVLLRFVPECDEVPWHSGIAWCDAYRQGFWTAPAPLHHVARILRAAWLGLRSPARASSRVERIAELEGEVRRLREDRAQHVDFRRKVDRKVRELEARVTVAEMRIGSYQPDGSVVERNAGKVEDPSG